MPRPRNPKGRASNPNYRIAITALICVKSPTRPQTKPELSGSNSVLNCTNDRREYGPASATGDYL
jgi:hypothetical protein